MTAPVVVPATTPDLARLRDLWNGGAGACEYHSVTFGARIAERIRASSSDDLGRFLHDDWPDWISPLERSIVVRAYGLWRRRRGITRAAA